MVFLEVARIGRFEDLCRVCIVAGLRVDRRELAGRASGSWRSSASGSAAASHFVKSGRADCLRAVETACGRLPVPLGATCQRD